MMNKVKSQTKGVSRKVTIGICLSCLIVVAAILGLSANSHTTQPGQFGLMGYPGVVEITSTTLAKSDAATQARVSETYGKLPLSFEVNVG